ncbi:MAG: branched-chain amino acid aminotransferase, partial [Lapillicoccus sp.]
MTTMLSPTTSLTFEVSRRPDPLPAAERDAILADPGFGKKFTDHMVTATWRQGEGWRDAKVGPYGPLSIDPACAVLHYAQEIFEGLKAYRHADGTIWTFRPEANAQRFQRSARRLTLPELATADFVESLRALVEIDQDWVPEPGAAGEKSLYLRPFMFASETFLGVRPAAEVLYAVIASPAGAYFPGGVKPVSLWISTDFARAGAGGTGAAKCGGNYASSLAGQLEGAEHGCDQAVFLDSSTHTLIEELGGMNLFLVYKDGRIVTPAMNGQILEGITRSSILE